MPLQGIKINCHSFVLDYVDFSFNRLTSTRRALSNDTQLHTEKSGKRRVSPKVLPLYHLFFTIQNI